jgi:hypothetical protein
MAMIRALCIGNAIQGDLWDGSLPEWQPAITLLSRAGASFAGGSKSHAIVTWPPPKRDGLALEKNHSKSISHENEIRPLLSACASSSLPPQHKPIASSSKDRTLWVRNWSRS